MARKTDFRRRSAILLAGLRRALELETISVAYHEVDGPHAKAIKPTGNAPAGLDVVGGQWDALAGEYVGPPPAKAQVDLPIQAQQTAPLISTAQFMAIFGGHRSGKTMVARYTIQKEMIEHPGTIVFYALPRFSKEDIVVEEFLGDLDRWIVSRDRKLHKYTLVNGSVLRLFSMVDKGHEEACLGYECDIFVLEEFREMPSRILKKAFSRVISRDGRLIIATSPEVGHVIEDIANKDYHNEAGEIVDWDVHHLSMKANPYIKLDPKDPDKAMRIARKMYDPNRYARDVDGKFVAETGQDFYNFDRAIHVVDAIPGVPCTEQLWASEDLWLNKDPRYHGPGTIEPDPTFMYCRVLAMDFGATVMSALEGIITTEVNPGPFAASVSGGDLTYESTNLGIVKEHQARDTSLIDFHTRHMIPAKLTPDRVVIFCDPAGKGREITTGQGPVELLRQLGYKVYCPDGANFRKPGIDAIRTRLHMKRLFFLATCKMAITSMIKIRTFGRPAKAVSTDPYGHLPDALRYLVQFLFPERELFKADGKALAAVLRTYAK